MSEQRVTDQELAASEPAPLILLGGRNAADLRDARPAEPMNATGPILGELNALRKLYLAAVERIERIEDAEELRGLSGQLRDAYTKHLTGDHVGAIAMLRADLEEEPAR